VVFVYGLSPVFCVTNFFVGIRLETEDRLLTRMHQVARPLYRYDTRQNCMLSFFRKLKAILLHKIKPKRGKKVTTLLHLLLSRFVELYPSHPYTSSWPSA
jgi:hypothetical protein